MFQSPITGLTFLTDANFNTNPVKTLMFQSPITGLTFLTISATDVQLATSEFQSPITGLTFLTRS